MSLSIYLCRPQLWCNRETVDWKHVSRKEIHLYGLPTIRQLRLLERLLENTDSTGIQLSAIPTSRPAAASRETLIYRGQNACPKAASARKVYGATAPFLSRLDQLTITVKGSTLSAVTDIRNRWPSAATSNGLKPTVSLGKAKSSCGKDGSVESGPGFIATAMSFSSSET